jgi:hypothetical protein
MKNLIILFLIIISGSLLGQTQVCPDVVCINSQNQDYFVINTPGSTYNWTLSGGGTIASGQGTSTVFINWGSVVGTYILQVIETNSQGCIGLPVTCQIDVINGPNVSITPIGPFCSGDPIVNLVGNPSGGVFSGNGVVGNTFNPTFGNQTITYTYNDPNGCSGSATFNIIVNPTPNTSPIYKQ